MGITVPKRMLVDESVWLAACLDFSDQGDEAHDFLEACVGRADLIATPLCLRDTWHDLKLVLRHVVESEGGTYDERIDSVCTGIAWDCVDFIKSNASVVTVGTVDTERAAELKDLHPAYEDALLLATAEGAQADCVVTFDQGLVNSLSVRCLSPREALRAYNLA